MQDFYHMCCMDTPFYVEKPRKPRRDIVNMASNVNVQKNGAIAEVNPSNRSLRDEPRATGKATGGNEVEQPWQVE